MFFCVGDSLNRRNNDNSDLKNDMQYEVYKLVVELGATYLSYEQWLVSIKSQKGEEGHTFSIVVGSNENWFIDNVDINVNLVV